MSGNVFNCVDSQSLTRKRTTGIGHQVPMVLEHDYIPPLFSLDHVTDQLDWSTLILSVNIQHTQVSLFDPRLEFILPRHDNFVWVYYNG